MRTRRNAFSGTTPCTPILKHVDTNTEDEYRRFVEEMDKAKEIANNLYLQTNGLAGISKIYEEEKE